MNAIQSIFRKYAPAYIEKFAPGIPDVHIKVINDIITCRTPDAGGQLYYCQDCRKYHYSYHSCGNRHCNLCQQDKNQQWLHEHIDALLPVPYFLLTFTMHPNLRMLARSHQKLFYNLLFRCAAQALQTLADDPKYLGGEIGMMGVLHTWGRNLSFHPHIHFVLPGIAYFEDGDALLFANEKFLLPVKALSKIFKAKFRDALKKNNPNLFTTIDPKTWKDDWVVHCKNAGDGEATVTYLASYVFKVAICNNRILSYDDEKVTFKYQDSNTGEWKTITLHPFEFIRRFLQHVLPRGFQKVRYYGFMTNVNKPILKRIRQLLNINISRKIQSKETAPSLKPVTCPICHKQMQLLANILPGMPWPHAPPHRQYELMLWRKPVYS